MTDVAVLADVATDVPLVAVDGDPTQGAGTVTVDQSEGAWLATQHLRDAGHQTVWDLVGPIAISPPDAATPSGLDSSLTGKAAWTRAYQHRLVLGGTQFK
jgi:hypothetical protein